MPAPVTTNDEVHGVATQMADAVEQYNSSWFSFTHFTHFVLMLVQIVAGLTPNTEGRERSERPAPGCG